MTLDEAIKHCEEKAKEQRAWAKELIGGLVVEDCLECAKEHEQLAAWLRELKALREEKELLLNFCKLNDKVFGSSEK